MKNVIAVISMIILISCYGWKNPEDSTGGHDNHYQYEPGNIDNYVGIAVIKMECGDFCQNPMIKVWPTSVDPYEKYYYPDSAGSIYIEYRVEHRDSRGNYTTFPVEAFMNADTSIVQVTNMWFKNDDLTDEDIPVTEIIFADSLAED